MYIRDGIAYADDQITQIPEIAEVRALDDYVLYAKFVTGEERLFDFKPLLQTEAFMPLRNINLFNTVHLDHGVPVWVTEGIDLDYSPCAILANGAPYK